MLLTLHRYIFRELFRVFVLAAVGLTLILSLGSILQPVQQYGVGPRQVVHLMGYFLPITLTFVLPMAALFAGSLVYGRFASDNELDACRASGVNLLTLVRSGLALAIMVAIANLLLSFHVMPVFVHLAEKSLKADAKQILFRNIQRRRYYKLPPDEKYLIYADQADLKNDTLSGVVVVEVEGYAIKNVLSAESAKVNFNHHDRFDEVQIIAYKPSQMGAVDEGGAEWGSLTVEFGSLLGDEIKFKKIDEILSIRADLNKGLLPRFYPIEKLARETYAQFTMELLASDIKTAMDKTAGSDETLTETNADANSFYELLGEPNSVRFTTSQCVLRDMQIDLSGEVVVTEYNTDTKETLHTFTGSEASLHLEGNTLAPTLTMDLRAPEEEGSVQLRMWYIIRGLILPRTVAEIVTRKFKAEDGSLRTKELTSDLPELELELELQPTRQLTILQSKLRREILKTRAQIQAEIHSRLVFGIGCVPMILIGIGLGIVKKGGHLLSAFAASCVPAAVLIVCIMSGKHITKNLGAQAVSGITLMWAGLGFLALLAVVIFWRLLKR